MSPGARGALRLPRRRAHRGAPDDHQGPPRRLPAVWRRLRLHRRAAPGGGPAVPRGGARGAPPPHRSGAPAGHPVTAVLVAAAKPWTYWISPVLVIGAVLAVLAISFGYLVKVVSAKYP